VLALANTFLEGAVVTDDIQNCVEILTGIQAILYDAENYFIV
jgi:hypothetical protein